MSAKAPSSARSFAVILASDLRFNRRAPLTWGVTLGATCALIAAIWPSVEESIGAAMKGYPAAIKQAFNITELSNVTQYVDVEMLSFIVPFAMAFFAIRVSTHAMVWAEEHGYLDSLLALPVSRRVLVAGSFTATAVLLAINLLIMWGMTIAVAEIVGAHAAVGKMGAGFANVFPISITFMGIAILAAGFLRRSAAVTGIAAGVMVAMYVLDLVGKISPDLHDVRRISAFRWYGSAVQSGFDWGNALILIGAGVLMAIVGTLMFERRDIS